MMPATKTAKKKTVAPKASKGKGFTDSEKAAMRERIKELQRGDSGEAVVQEKLRQMAAPDRALGERLHAVIMASDPTLEPKLWYGMPAYYKDGKSLCFFQDAAKFKTRYATLGFNERANLDEGNVWPIAYAVSKLTAADEARIAALVKKAAS